jgi:hypothetical protein
LRAFFDVMGSKSGKKKAKKAAKATSQPSVLANLPSTRPTRLGGTRAASGPSRSKAASDGASAAKPAAPKPKPARSKPRAAATAKAAETEEPRRPSGPPRGTEVVTTAVQAVGEIAQIGLTVGTQVVKRAAGRLPRP